MTDQERIAKLEEENALLRRKVEGLEQWATKVGSILNRLQDVAKDQNSPYANLFSNLRNLNGRKS